MIILSSSANPLLLRSDGNNIFTASLDGAVNTYLTDDGAGYFNGIAAWSRDGSKIVYSHQAPNAPPYIWTMNAGGGDKAQLTFGSLAGGEATFLDAALTVIGVIAGSTLWWFTVTTIVGIFHRHIDASVMQNINRVFGLAVTGFGVIVLGNLALKLLVAH